MTMGDRVAVIRKGELQQIDTPREIYSNPKNIFVAGFIGSPSMNFVYAKIKSKDDVMELTFGDNQITYKDEKKDKLQPFENKEIILGIRPEAFEDGYFANEADYSESLKVKVSLLEQLGSDSYIHFYKDIKPVQTEAIEEILADEGEDITVLGDNTKFIARINPNSTVVEGEEVELRINPSKLHFFDPESGDVI
jgi:multiple sugar transport system ATP-binding protein